MNIRYSIRELEHLSGIKAHTLRIWEQRYNILSPKRTETNIRYYDGKDLKLVLKIALLNQSGYKISKISKMSSAERDALVEDLSKDITQENFQISALTTAMIEMDEESFEYIIMNNIVHNGFEATMLNLVYPFLEKIGILWLSGSINPAQEHFITNLIRQKLIVGIDKIKIKTDINPHIILFLPEGELHELGLLFAHYLLKVRGCKVTYLGASVPLDDVVSVAQYKQADIVFAILTSYPVKRKLQNFVTKLSNSLPHCKIFLTGYQAIRIAFPIQDNVKVLHKVTDLTNAFEIPSVYSSNGNGNEQSHNSSNWH